MVNEHRKIYKASLIIRKRTKHNHHEVIIQTLSPHPVSVFCFCFAILEMELRASCVIGKCSITELYSQLQNESNFKLLTILTGEDIQEMILWYVPCFGKE
jgi:hypothetical protein